MVLLVPAIPKRNDQSLHDGREQIADYAWPSSAVCALPAFILSRVPEYIPLSRTRPFLKSRSFLRVCHLVSRQTPRLADSFLLTPIPKLAQILFDILIPLERSSSLPRNGASLSRRSTAHGAAHSVHPNPSSPQARRYFAAEKYVSVSQVLVYIGTLRSQGRDQRIPMLARVSIADYRGRILLDTLVGPTHPVEDYRTEETGYTSSTFTNAPTFQDTQRRVASIIRTKILVGHCLWKFLSVLGLSHPASDTRDLALFLPLREGLRRQYIVDLPTLIQEVMGRSLGMQYEDSVESARAAIDLFRCCENVFDSRINAGEWPCDLPPLTYAEYFT